METNNIEDIDIVNWDYRKHLKTINIEDIVKSDDSTGSTINDDVFVYDEKNNFTFLVIPIPLDCCGTIDWACIVKYDVYEYKGAKEWDDNEYIGSMRFVSKISLRRLRTKYVKRQIDVSKK